MVLCTFAAQGKARAQQLAGVELAWRGPPSCAEPLDTLAMARGLVDPGWRAVEAIRIRVSLRDLGSEALELSFEAEGADGPLRRALQVTSCSEARRAAAVWIALSVGEQSAVEGAAVPGEATPPTHQEPVAAPAAAAAAAAMPPPAPVATPQPKPEAKPQADPPPEPPEVKKAPPVARADRDAEVTPTRFARSGFSLAIAVGVEGPVLTSAGVPFAAWLGWRATHFELDVGVSVWVPTKDEISNVEVRLDQLGAVLGVCYWVSFDRWELGPSAKLLIERVDAELNGQDAEAKSVGACGPGPARGGMGVAPRCVAARHRRDRVAASTDPLHFGRRLGEDDGVQRGRAGSARVDAMSGAAPCI